MLTDSTKVCEVMTNQSLGDEVDRLVHLRKLQGLGNENSLRGRLQAWGK